MFFGDTILTLLLLLTVTVAIYLYRKLPPHDPRIHRSSIGHRPPCGGSRCRVAPARGLKQSTEGEGEQIEKTGY